MQPQMQPQAMTKLKWFWAWQDRKEEAWLESMSREGWHLKDVGFLTYVFERGEPEEMVYRLDFRTSKEVPEYVEFVQGAGWEYVGQMSSWLYFRAPAQAGKTTELYTDAEGKIAKYQRVIGILVITGPVYWVVLLSHLDRFTGWVALPIVVFFLALTGLYAFSMFKLIGRINQLKRT